MSGYITQFTIRIDSCCSAELVEVSLETRVTEPLIGIKDHEGDTVQFSPAIWELMKEHIDYMIDGHKVAKRNGN